MNIFSVTFSLILSNDKKGFCRNSRKISDCQVYSFFLKILPSATKKAYFSKFALYIREKSSGVYLRKILKIKTENCWEAVRVNCKSIWRKDGYQSFIRIGVVQLVGASRSVWPVVFFFSRRSGYWRFLALYGKTSLLKGSGLKVLTLELNEIYSLNHKI